MTPRDSKSPYARPATYEIARLLILRLMAIVYCFAFAVAWNQNPGLIGQNGIMPFQKPGASEVSLFHIFGATDNVLEGLAGFGLGLSMFLVFFPVRFSVEPVLSGVSLSAFYWAPWLLLYLIYLTIRSAGDDRSTFFSYGWESQILETGLICVFFAANGHTWADDIRKSCCIWLYRWLILRISLGAGLIKFRGDGCWHDKTCLW